MTTIYALWHVHEDSDGDEDQLLIGVYSTEEKARKVIERLREKPGFKDYPEGFQVHDMKVDRDGWTEGFISAAEAMNPRPSC